MSAKEDTNMDATASGGTSGEMLEKLKNLENTFLDLKGSGRFSLKLRRAVQDMEKKHMYENMLREMEYPGLAYTLQNPFPELGSNLTRLESLIEWQIEKKRDELIQNPMLIDIRFADYGGLCPHAGSANFNDDFRNYVHRVTGESFDDICYCVSMQERFFGQGVPGTDAACNKAERATALRLDKIHLPTKAIFSLCGADFGQFFVVNLDHKVMVYVGSAGK